MGQVRDASRARRQVPGATKGAPAVTAGAPLVSYRRYFARFGGGVSGVAATDWGEVAEA